MQPMKEKQIIIASHNRAKSREMLTILSEGLSDFCVEIGTLADYEHAPEPEEHGTTYAENALIKARACVAFTGEISIADDAGLEIDALQGAPGLYSKRFGGESTPFPVKLGMVLEQMWDVPDEKRTARFRCDVAIVHPDGREWILEDTCEGRIAHSPRGSYGFGYDPIFELPQLGCTMAELPPEFKHRISHRGKVLRQAIPVLRTLFC
jgi:XTP/dITP diphosphohydrolase